MYIYIYIYIYNLILIQSMFLKIVSLIPIIKIIMFGDFVNILNYSQLHPLKIIYC